MGTRYTIRFGDAVPASGGAVGTVIQFPTSGDFNVYPRTLGGVTLGVIEPGPGNTATGQSETAAWASGDDPLLRTRSFRANGSGFTFRFDLPEGPGDYRVWLIATSAFYLRTRWTILDGVGGTQRFQRDWGSDSVFGSDEPSNAEQYVVNNSGALGPFVADVATATTPLELRFDSGTLVFRYADHPSGIFASVIAALVFEKIDTAPAGPSAAVLRRRRGFTFI